jgi:hypothetical protein
VPKEIGIRPFKYDPTRLAGAKDDINFGPFEKATVISIFGKCFLRGNLRFVFMRAKAPRWSSLRVGCRPSGDSRRRHVLERRMWRTAQFGVKQEWILLLVVLYSRSRFEEKEERERGGECVFKYPGAEAAVCLACIREYLMTGQPEVTGVKGRERCGYRTNKIMTVYNS